MIVSGFDIKTKHPKVLAATVGKASYLNLKGFMNGLTDLLRSNTKRNLRHSTTDKGLQQYGRFGTSATHLLDINSSMAFAAKFE